jgi:hypothetical protein
VNFKKVAHQNNWEYRAYLQERWVNIVSSFWKFGVGSWSGPEHFNDDLSFFLIAQSAVVKKSATAVIEYIRLRQMQNSKICDLLS